MSSSVPGHASNAVAESAENCRGEVNDGEIDNVGVETEEKIGVAKTNRRSGRRIPFLPNKGPGRRRGTNYVEEYPPDELGAEMGPNARVWRVYLDEADEYDAEMIDSFKDTTDVLLVFAGLFSAVVTTFVSTTSQALQPDYAQVTASLMTELVSLQRAMAIGTPVATITPSQLTFDNAYTTTTSFDRWVNGLWFTSLSLSLVSALLSVLVKQWLQYYISALSGTPRDRVLIRHFRFMGLATWKVPEIVGALPVLLHISLFMFMAGLVIFVWVLDVAMASIILSITAMCFVFYSLSHLLASLYPSCSYKTPISDVLLYVKQVLQWIGGLRILHEPYDDNDPLFRGHIRLFGHVLWLSRRRLNMRARRTVEQVASTELTDDVLLSALNWLRSASSDPSSTIVIWEAFAGLPFHLDRNHIPAAVKDDIWHEVRVSASTHLQPVALLSYCSTDVSPLLPDRAYNAFIGLAHDSPTTQALRAVHYSDNMPPNRELLIGIVSGQTSLPPWLWERLFEHDSAIPTANPLKLLILLLEVLKRAEIFARRSVFPRARANWSLSSTVGLVKLCQSDVRMANTIFQFACRILQHDSHAERLQNPWNDNGVFEAQSFVQFLHAILDHLQARLQVTEPILDYIMTVERTLLSIPTSHWSDAPFIHAFHRCVGLVRTVEKFDVVSYQPLYHRIPVPNSPGLMMLYILDILQHPWPAARIPDLADGDYSFMQLCHTVLSTQDRDVFDVFLECDGLPTFRRCFPIHLTFMYQTPDLCMIFMQYLEFVHATSNPRCLSDISRPENLAWLIWLSLYPGYSRLVPQYPYTSNCQKFRHLLHSLSIDRQNWLDAVEIVVEELRKDSASFGLKRLRYAEVKAGLEALGLGAEFKLYGYASPARGHLSGEFKRETENTNILYGPYAVIYEPQQSSAPIAVKSWYHRLENSLRRRRQGNDKDLEKGPAE